LRKRAAFLIGRSAIVGEAKTPDALRNASDQFFEWTPPAPVAELTSDAAPKVGKVELVKTEAPKPEAAKLTIKRRPRFLVEAVSLLAGDTSEGKVGLGVLGQYLKRTDPAFSPKAHGHSGLLHMIKTYDLLVARQEEGGQWSVALTPKTDPAMDALAGADEAV
jgi:hypothetical protein